METTLTLKCYSSASNKCTVSWEDDEARYHIWVDVDGNLENTIYKNPISGIEPRDPEYFQTRQLDPCAKCHTEIIRRAFRLATPGKVAWAISTRVRLEEEAVVQAKTDRAEKIRKGFITWIGNQGVDASTIAATSEDRLISLKNLLNY